MPNFYPKTTYKKEPSAADKYKNYKYGQIAVTVQPTKLDIKSKQPYNVINLYNVDTKSANEIVERLKDTTKQRVTVNAWIDKEEPTHVQIKVRPSDFETWLDGSDLNAVQSVLIKGGYNPDEVKHLEDEIAIGFHSKVKEEVKQVHDKAGETAMDMWQNYLSKINDPVTRKQIELYSRVYRKVSYGNILSVKNTALIKSYDKGATFVLAPGKWKELFGRGIKRNAKPLPLYVYINKGKATNKDIEDAKKTAGWEETDDEDLSTQVKYNINMKANKTGGFTLRYIGYDVRDTYLLSGAKEDKWSSEIGLLNNLSGELNAAAIQDRQKRNVQPETSDTIMDKRTEKAATWMENFCKENGYNTSTNYQDASNRLADYLLSYCSANATKKANILSEGNIRTYAENATQITLIITKLGLSALSRFNKQYNYDKKEAAALMNVVFGIARDLEENSVVNEGILDWLRNKAAFVKMFMSALKQIGCSVVNKPEQQDNVQQQNNQPQQNNVDTMQNGETIENIRNNFNESFNRINKNYFYNDKIII